MTRSSIDGENRSARGVDARARPPLSKAHILERPALLARLRECLGRQLVGLQAPAGFGKTTLLAQAARVLRAQGFDCGWLTVAPSDGGPGRLTAALARALWLAGEADRRPWPKALRAVEEGDEAAVEAMASAMARRRNPVALILDDCHRAECEGFDRGLAALLRVLPDNAHVVLAGRARPHLSLSGLRARGLYAELSAADLRMSRREAEALVGAAPGFIDRCEGWPAPLQLARQCTETGLPMPEAVREYILDELLAPLSVATREFLIHVSIAPAFDIALGEALTGQTLDRAARSALQCLAPLVEGRPESLRMNLLLRDALAAELVERGPDAAVRLHAAAAQIFARRDDLEGAVRHAGAAGDYTFAATAIQRAGGVRLFIRAGAPALNNLLGKLPPAAVDAAEGLRLARAVVLSKQGRLAKARGLVEEARAALLEGRSPAAAYDDILHIDDLLQIYEDCDADAEAIAAREREAEQAPVRDTWRRGWIYNHLTIKLCRLGDLWRAQQAAHISLACYREEGPTYTQAFMQIHLALIGVASGRIAMALEPAREAERLIDATHAEDDALRAIAAAPMAEILYAQNDLVGARRRLDFAIPVMAAGEGWVDLYARAFETRVRIALIEEGLGAAIAFIERACEVAAARDLWRLRWTMDALRHEVLCRTHLLVDDDENGRHLARDLAAGSTPEGHRLTWRERLVGRISLARGALLRNELGAAREWLDGAIAEGEALGAYQFVIPALILRAIAEGRGEGSSGGLNAFLRAAAIAAPQGVLRPFVDEGAAMSAFLRQALRRHGVGAMPPNAAEFVASLLAARASEGRGAVGSAGLLSDREHEILGLLNQGLANKAIARSLSVAEATVKFHLKNLYGKLGVNSRVMALTVARQHRLLH